MPLRIALYIENHLYGGLERFATDLANALEKSGHSVTFFHNADHGLTLRLERLLRSAIPRVSLPVFSEQGLWAGLRSLMPRFPAQCLFWIARPLLRLPFLVLNVLVTARGFKGKTFDVLHVINGGYPAAESCLSAVLAARLLGLCPAFFSILSAGHSSSPRRLKWLDPWIVRGVSAFLTNSEASKEGWARHRGFPEGKIRVLYTGVPMPPSQEAPSPWRSRWGIGGEPVVGALGPLYPPKGHRFLLDALPEVLKVHPQVRSIIAGEGSSKKELEDLSRERGLEGAVAFIGFFPDSSPQFLFAIDIFVHLTLVQTEAFPYAILEAMSCGRAVVATRVGGVPEQIEHGVSGWLIPPGDPRALAQALIHLLSHPEERGRLGARARERAERLFSHDRMVEETLKIYGEGRASRDPGR